ncbi:hypothetical protein Pcinc_038241 [Petrolisthes cinctipes]|uniref:Uncharacterized protein n=1 Tax=Petrolisthes cinctipes TaxID=88211 RepID=A0AAE1BUV4_PETCI|nr:hypothetical protein Pcinc_038241 [Petrolisthes cinctipes]
MNQEMRLKSPKCPGLSLTAEQETDLVEWLKTNEIFYNKKLNIYRNIHERNRLLNEKAKELNCHGVYHPSGCHHTQVTVTRVAALNPNSMSIHPGTWHRGGLGCWLELRWSEGLEHGPDSIWTVGWSREQRCKRPACDEGLAGTLALTPALDTHADGQVVDT